MRLNIEQLTAQLTKKIAPLYFLVGDEPLLQQEACQQIRHACKTQGFTERERFDVQGTFDWSLINQASQNLSLFAEKKIIEIHIGKHSLNDAGRKQLIALAQQACPDLVYLITMDKADSAAQKTQWFKALDTQGIVIMIWPIDATQLAPWLNKRFRQQGLTADTTAIQLLVERSEGHLLAAVQAIEKVQLLFTEKHVTANMIDAAIADSAHFDIFNCVDSALAGDNLRCLQILNYLQQAAIEPVLILWALSRELRQLTNMQQQLQNGIHLTEIFKQYFVWQKRQALIKMALYRKPATPWQSLLDQAYAIDEIIKGVKQGDCWVSLEKLILAMADSISKMPQG